MSSPLLLIAGREFQKVVRKPSFWLSTLLVPALILVVSLVSGYSATVSEANLQKSAEEATKLVVVDESGVIHSELLQPPFVREGDRAVALAQLTAGEADGVFFYPADVLTSGQIFVALQSQGVIQNSRFSEQAKALVQLSLEREIADPVKRHALGQSYAVQVEAYENGALVRAGAESLVVPIASVAAFFLMTSFGVGFFLMSVSEEKENRMMEMMLSTVRPRVLIWGKVLGLLTVVLVQIVFLFGLGLLVLRAANPQTLLYLDISKLHVEASQVFWGIFYLLAGFLFMANIMVGVGAAMPTYKEAQSFSSVFVILSILPIYLSAIIVTDPDGQIARVLSFLPFTGPIVLLFRSALGEITLLEKLLSALSLILYIAASAKVAFWLFALGSLQYAERISWRGLWGKLGLGRGK